MEYNDIPESFQGMPIVLLTAALMAIAFLDSPESYRRKKSMSITGIIMAAVIVGGTGLFIGIFLGLADKKLTVKVDEKEEAILGVLPGNNCGGCGYPGCSGLLPQSQKAKLL